MSGGPGIDSITGSVPDVVGAVLSISEAMKAGKGFVFNTAVFEIEHPSAPDARSSVPVPPASSSMAGRQGEGGNAEPIVNDGPTIFVLQSGAVGESGGIRSVAELRLRQVVYSGRSVVAVELHGLDRKFDLSLDAVAVEIVVSNADATGAQLTLKGFANPGGIGYAHFMGALHVQVDDRRRLTTRVLFASQSPEPESGTGIFGKTVRVTTSRGHIGVHIARTPLF